MTAQARVVRRVLMALISLISFFRNLLSQEIKLQSYILNCSFKYLQNFWQYYRKPVYLVQYPYQLQQSLRNLATLNFCDNFSNFPRRNCFSCLGTGNHAVILNVLLLCCSCRLPASQPGWQCLTIQKGGELQYPLSRTSLCSFSSRQTTRRTHFCITH